MPDILRIVEVDTAIGGSAVTLNTIDLGPITLVTNPAKVTEGTIDLNSGEVRYTEHKIAISPGLSSMGISSLPIDMDFSGVALRTSLNGADDIYSTVITTGQVRLGAFVPIHLTVFCPAGCDQAPSYSFKFGEPPKWYFSETVNELNAKPVTATASVNKGLSVTAITIDKIYLVQVLSAGGKTQLGEPTPIQPSKYEVKIEGLNTDSATLMLEWKGNLNATTALNPATESEGCRIIIEAKATYSDGHDSKDKIEVWCAGRP